MRELAWAAERYCEKDPTKVLKIVGNADPDDVYLIRYFLLRTKYLSIYVHRFMRSDRDNPHDHPFSFVSYVVTGEYREERYTYNPASQHYDFSSSRRREGSWAYRHGTEIHAVKIDRSYRYEDRYQAPLTVVFRGPYFRPWGFWTDILTQPVWTVWTRYLGKEDKRE